LDILRALEKWAGAGKMAGAVERYTGRSQKQNHVKKASAAVRPGKGSFGGTRNNSNHNSSGL
jgi:hypothetical protein